MAGGGPALAHQGRPPLGEAVLANLLSFVVAAAAPEKGGRGEVTVRVTAHDQRALVQIDAAGPDAAFSLAKEAMNGTDPLDLEHDQMGLALVFSRRAALVLEGGNQPAQAARRRHPLRVQPAPERPGSGLGRVLKK